MGSATSPSPFNMWSSGFPPRRPSAFLRVLIPAILLIILFYYLSGPTIPVDSAIGKPYGPEDKQETQPQEKQSQETQSYPDKQQEEQEWNYKANDETPRPAGAHPIDSLIKAADTEFSNLVSKESRSLKDAAAAYRQRRGRHPPPGFKKWYEFAKENNAVIVEDFWDQIYHDLEPFWAVPAPTIRKEARDFEMTIRIRNGVATAGSDWFWTKIWLNMTKTVEHLLPDMDIALNAMDEPRLVVPWEQIDEYMTTAAQTRVMKPVKSVVSEFQKLPKIGDDSDVVGVETRKKDWENTKHYWQIARRGCAPNSKVRKAGIMTDFDHPPVFNYDLAAPHTESGYVSNHTKSADFCHQPDLQALEGIFVRPLSTKATKVFFPMFGGSKLAVNNEILLPAPMYWNEEKRFTGGDDHGSPWGEKQDKVIWRGVATGGRNTATNWRAFQRHRFVAMNNGTLLSRAETWTEAPPNFALPSKSYGLKSQEEGRLGEWVDNWTDVGFTELMCDETNKDVGCDYSARYLSTMKGMPMADQFNSKYLPDIDGNSFSGRYLGFLRSTSLPIKATLWREWHDSRLVAWKHFVPMDNRFGDWYGIMEYFLGYGDSVPGHDAAAQRIASDGKEWADKVLRKEDMQIYVLRLLLEYARISDERRESMGWVEDLL